MRQMTGLGLTLLVAGSDTVYQLLNFAIHSLSLYPEHQRKIRKEAHNALKKHGVSEFNFDVVQDLSFTFQCLNEVARLYPVSAFLMRQCLDDFQIAGTRYSFKKGDRLILPLYSLGRDETLFRDPHMFDPDRFFSKDKNLTVPETLLSFGIGPRQCRGYKHGMFMAASILASLLYKYDIKPRSHQNLMDAPYFHPRGFTISPRKDIIIDLVPCGDPNDIYDPL